MEIAELGGRLKARRTATGRTIASVAMDAGLSVPYIANLENGRGNPTLSAVTSLATALGARLKVELTDDAATPEPAPLPESLLRFARSARFAAEAGRLAKPDADADAGAAATANAAANATATAGATANTGASPTATRERLLHAMAAMGALATRPLGEPDWHRLLDAAVLMSHPL